MISSFSKKNFHSLCDLLAAKDADLRQVLTEYGYPAFWHRKPDFRTLVHIILEQQVSLASAKAALDQLERRLGNITHTSLLSLSDEEMRACYFSRQKMGYARHLAESIRAKHISLPSLQKLDDDAVRTELKKIRGIGDWSADVFLMMALHRCDCFPLGDVALITSMKEVKRLPADTLRENIGTMALQWHPYRTIAAYMLWWAYLSRRNRT